MVKLRDLPFSLELKLPVDMATETFAFLGRKGRGKTYGAQRYFELLHGAGVQCVALDPVGNWWSLRVGKDGKSPGLPVYVFGGPRGDVPILPDAGAFVARVIVEKGISVILDVSRFRKAERKRFMTAFAEEFFHLKKDAPSPVHLFIEEAHKFVPQFVRDGEEQMLGAMEDIVRIGRNYGIGASLISQRSASVNKDVLTQVECLVAYQTGSAQDKKAIKNWVEENDEEGLALLAEMKTLQRGEALFWSPSVLQVFKKIHITQKTTLDASSTPKIGAKARKPVKLAKVDLKGIETAMKEVVATAEANNVTALKAKLKQLEAQLAKKTAPMVKTETRKEIVVAVPQKLLTRVEKLAERLTKDTNKLDAMRDALAQAQQAIISEVGNMTTMVRKASGLEKAPPSRVQIPQTKVDQLQRDARQVAAQRVPRIGAQQLPPPKMILGKASSNGDLKLDGPSRRVLAALSWFESLGIEQPTSTALAFMSKYSGENGAFNNIRGKLRSAGFVDYPSPGTVQLTQYGRAYAPNLDAPATGEALRSSVLSVLDGPQQRVLTPVLEAYPKAISSKDLAPAAGYGSENGAFNNIRGRLRTLGLVTYPSPGMVRAADLLFPD